MNFQMVLPLTVGNFLVRVSLFSSSLYSLCSQEVLYMNYACGVQKSYDYCFYKLVKSQLSHESYYFRDAIFPNDK
jgi:hypothetical protein